MDGPETETDAPKVNCRYHDVSLCIIFSIKFCPGGVHAHGHVGARASDNDTSRARAVMPENATHQSGNVAISATIPPRA